MTEKPLKEQNRIGLAIVVFANASAFYLLSTFQVFDQSQSAMIKNVWPNLIPVGSIVILVSVLNAQLDSLTKARLVFFRWRNPLPASTAFSRLGPKDPRVDMSALTRRLRKLPIEPERQDAVWYGLYREVKSDPAVIHANREYIFTRDYNVFAAAMLLLFGVVSIWTVGDLTTRFWYLTFLIMQFLLTGNAARNHGKRLVCTVLALSAKPNSTSRKK